MESIFSIDMSFKISGGIENFGTFSIGNSRDRAIDIFKQLKGRSDITEREVLFMTFIETNNGLPVNLKIIGCTLDQLTENCKIIARELFKLKNIDMTG